MKKKFILLTLAFLALGCVSTTVPDIGNNRIATISDCDELYEERQTTENKIEELKTLIHRNNVGTVISAILLHTDFGSRKAHLEGEMIAYTERQKLIDKQISLHCSK